MELIRCISIIIVIFFELAMLLASLAKEKDEQFRRRGLIFFAVFLIPLLYIIIK